MAEEHVEPRREQPPPLTSDDVQRIARYEARLALDVATRSDIEHLNTRIDDLRNLIYWGVFPLLAMLVGGLVTIFALSR